MWSKEMLRCMCVCIHTYTHTHTYIHIIEYIDVLLSLNI